MNQGQSNGNAKITEQTVRDIFTLRSFAWTSQRIAKIVGLNASTVRYILRRDIWAHVELPHGLARLKKLKVRHGRLTSKNKNDMDLKKLNPTLIEALRNANILDDQEAKIKLAESKSGCDRYLDQYITVVPKVKIMKERVRSLSRIDDPVLICGDTGTGKELLANALHGDRDPDKFIPINCAAMPEALMESNLFGHTAGSFTDAKKNKTGLLEIAGNGTMFMDEIGDLALPLQAKMLRALQERMIRPVGSEREVRINCRFVFATHMDLKKRISEGLFREDLYYRISTFIVNPTPLSERSKDWQPIVEELDDGALIREGSIRGVTLEKFCSMITPDMLEGNVRSLQQLVRRYIVLGILPGEE